MFQCIVTLWPTHGEAPSPLSRGSMLETTPKVCSGCCFALEPSGNCAANSSECVMVVRVHKLLYQEALRLKGLIKEGVASSREIMGGGSGGGGRCRAAALIGLKGEWTVQAYKGFTV